MRYPDPIAAAEACGEHILNLLESTISSGARASLAVSGGSSPRPMFEFFARTPFDWESVHLFWVDERCVPPDNPQSNFRLANEVWLGPAKFPTQNVHRVRTELTPREAALTYADELYKWFGRKYGEIPQFDVMHRGMGSDGHTASLFPGDTWIEDRRGLAANVWVEKMGQARVTLLPAVLEAARNSAMLVTGDDKIQALHAVLCGPRDHMKYPAQIAADKATWFVDEAAAALLPIEIS